MRFNAILEVLRRVLLIAAALLGVGVLAVIGNTIRLEIQGRRAEIEVTKLVGGSNAFVRRPFLYTGMLYGAGWRAARLGRSLTLAVLVLRDSVATLARLYGSRYVLRGAEHRRTSACCWGRACARLARGLDLRRPPPAQHRAARLKGRAAGIYRWWSRTAAPVARRAWLPSTCGCGVHRRRGCACRRSSAAR